MPRHAFTLLELLVVLGIMLLVAALSMGAFFRTGDTNRLVATERLVAGLIRQSVHQARTSGFPVSLVFTTDERTITGINQSPLVTITFDNGLPFDISSRPLGENDPMLWQGPGQTATGAIIAGILDPATGIPLAPLVDPTSPTTTLLLEKRLRLANRNGSRCDGFVVQIAINIPDPDSSPEWLPLMVLAPVLPAGGALLSDSDDAPIGFMLRRRVPALYTPNLPMTPKKQQAGPVASAPDLSEALRPTPTWEVLGWVRTDAGGSTFVSNIADPIMTGAVTGMENDDVRRLGIAGGRWHELALMWDGQRLDLLCDGATIASKTAPGRRINTPAPLAIWLAEVHVMGDLLDYLFPPPSTPPPFDAVVSPMLGHPLFDNLRIAAIGEGQAGQLPHGIGPTTSAVVSVTPQGRVSVNGNAAGQTLTFTGDFEKADQKATFVISGDGTISSSLSTGSK